MNTSCICYGVSSRKVDLDTVQWHRAKGEKPYRLCNHCGLPLRCWLIDKLICRESHRGA